MDIYTLFFLKVDFSKVLWVTTSKHVTNPLLLSVHPGHMLLKAPAAETWLLTQALKLVPFPLGP